MRKQLIGLFVEVERDLISERTKEGLAVAKAKGKLLPGGPRGPWGNPRHPVLTKLAISSKLFLSRSCVQGTFTADDERLAATCRWSRSKRCEQNTLWRM